MNVLRTPDERFENLPGYDFAPHYTEVNGLRMHYMDEGSGQTVLCLHGEPSWCYLYRKIARVLAPHHRVVAPDLIGFGRSDKPAEREAYTFAMHRDAVAGFIENLDLSDITLVCQDWGGLLGLDAATRMPARFARLVIMNTGLPTGEQPMSRAFKAWRKFAEKSTDMAIGAIIQGATTTTLSAEVIAAYDAPYPDQSYKAGALVFPLLVPINPDDEAAPHMRAAREVLRKWTKPVQVMFSDGDPVTRGGDAWFRENVPGAKGTPEITIENGGHFLQEDQGEEIGDQVLRFMDRTPLETPTGPGA